VDLRRLSLGERVAAGSGVALLACLFLDWLEELTAWELLAFVDVLLALLALTAVALALARGAGSHLPRWALAQVGVIACTLMLAFVIEGSEQAIGIWLGTLAAAGILGGGAAPPRQKARPRRPLRPHPRVEEGRRSPRGERPARPSEPSQPPVHASAPEAAPSRPLEGSEGSLEGGEREPGAT
jgi:hypothetical protein